MTLAGHRSHRALSRRQLLAAGCTASFGLAAAGLAACSSSRPNTAATVPNGSTAAPGAGTAGSTATSPGARAAAATPAPRTGGTLVAAQVADETFGTGYPFVGLAENTYLNLLPFEGLIRYRQDLQPELVLADSFSYNADRTKLTAKLKPGLTFYDGAPVTPEDVFFGIDLINNPKKYNLAGAFQLASLAGFVTGVNKVDDLTMEFTFDQPRVNMNDFFAQLNVVHAAAYDKVKQGQATPGTGAFTLQSWSPGQSLKFQANTGWHDHAKAGGPYLDGITVQVFGDQDAMGLAYQSGTVDLIIGAPASLAKNYKPAGLTFNTPKAGLTYAGCNVTNPVLKDSRVRQALFLALDRQRFVTELNEGFSTVTVQPWPSTSPAFDPALEAPFYDPAKAKSLLQAAGFSQDRPLLVEHRSDQTAVAQASVVKENFEAVGVKVDLAPLDPNAFTAKLRDRKFTDVWITTHAYSNLTPLTNFQVTFPYQIPNISYYESPDYKDIIARLQTLDPLSADAKAQYKRFNQLWLDDPWLLPLLPGTGIDLISKKVQGFGDFFVTPGVNMAAVWKSA